jgi:diguanylate cyclase (GGDEF)-like protein
VDQLLRPGVRLLRRFAVAGKFVAIALVLLVPLSILAGQSILSAADQARVLADERQGLDLVQPLSRLVTHLYQWRIATVTGHRHTDLAADLRAVDAAEASHGEDLGVHAEWLRLRDLIASLPAPATTDAVAATVAGAATATATDGTSGTDRAERVNRTDGTDGSDAVSLAVSLLAATQQALAMLDRVANASRLVLGQRLDSYYLAIALVDRLPSLLEATASTAENLPAGRPPAGEASAVARQVTGPLRRLTNDLGSAVAGTTWEGLDSGLREATIAVQTAVIVFGNAASGGGAPALAAPGDPGRRVTLAVEGMIDSLSSTLDHLLAEREHRSAQASAIPLIVALASVMVAAYLFAALARISSRDAQQVLGDINSLTTGALHQNHPLDGSDEFAQMSRAAVVARDHLTSLLGTLRYQATHDELTALANRALFTEKLREKLTERLTADAATAQRVGVVVIDLDGFKNVNDSFGHDIGDRLLRALGARVHRGARRHGLVARLGTDQFGVLIMDASDDAATAELVTGLKAALEQPVDVDGRRLRVRASVGIATTPEGGATATELMRNADIAMHLAESSGTGTLTVFEPAMHEATRDRTELSFDLVQAVEQHQLSVAYQPIVELPTGQVVGMEALARWQHPERGVIPPDVFIPLAEATGMIAPLGRWILREAVEQLAAWRAEFPGAHPLTMDVNLAADQLGDPALVEDVLSLISETGVEPQSIVLEITESAVVRDLDTALRRLRQLAAMGVRLALDDFGTGYSSLSYLRRLPVSVLKIDKSFVTASDQEGSAAVLLSGIVALGAGLGMQIVAEGVETSEQARRLGDAGCRLGQGFLWSQPTDAASVAALLRDGAHLLGHAVPKPRTTPSHPSPVIKE